ncbi:hypothetical protein [Psychrobacter sanguinis]|uniref:hypothetical protein n=1 Tax=Psychrobacter sanguinis TaxID=861445 RepID=UPI00020C759B|nr:hypothetical protein [Psychrobacter sanguinis]EGK15175.1 hypothetical protein HMPREF9373_0337 [Psychrobacter sp. 1501(2011)]MCD9151274.1 hypothetical protein [Psychrobacter sanguinis]
MTELTGWKRKAILLFASEKKLGAGEVVSSYSNKSYTDMKRKILSEEEVEWVENSDKPRLKDLSAHLNKVKTEFIDKPEICFYHATLIVLLRRGYKSKETYKEFEKLWETESDFLLSNLSLRWIVSACDTFVDHSPNPLRSAIFLNVSTLINTLKIYETEKFLRGFEAIDDINEKNVEALYLKHLDLYQGLTYFRIGTDDTLRNMRARYEAFKDLDQLATSILLFVFEQIQNSQTAFSLMKSLHKDEKSKWWN